MGEADGVRDLTLTPRPVADSVAELLAGARGRADMDKHVDSLSGSRFERVTVDGQWCVVKYTGHDLDWLARALGDRHCWALAVWRAGLLDALPSCIDHTILGAAQEPDGTVALLMRDVGEHLVPPGDDPLPHAHHRQFLDHLARAHARFWGFEDKLGLLGPGERYQALTPATGARERKRAHRLGIAVDPVPAVLERMWRQLREAAPGAHDLALALVTDPGPLVAALAQTPATFVHGDWKAGNLGVLPDGRTILLDWGWPGRAGPLVDLAWYLAVNCDRLPESKEDTIRAYRDRLEHQGIATRDWFDRQLDLALLGGFLQLGWSKSGAELQWWLPRIEPVARELLRS
jgi:hypothetical protein